MLISWEKLVNELRLLPNISQKNAEQIAYHLLKQDSQAIEKLTSTIALVQKTITLCEQCNNIAEKKLCSICQDQNREKILIVVESPLDIFKFEKIDQIRTYYHVLGQLIDIKSPANDSSIDLLIKRSLQYREIIFALSPTLHGIMTINYLKAILSNKKISQLGQGMPIGAAISYVDPLTLKAAFDNRKGLK